MCSIMKSTLYSLDRRQYGLCGFKQGEVWFIPEGLLICNSYKLSNNILPRNISHQIHWKSIT